ncbi:MAG: PAS domain S-box protein [Caldilineaceae bacterium]
MPTDHTATSHQKNVQHDYEQLITSIDGILWEADTDTFQFTYVSEQAERLLGYAAAQWLIPGFWEEHIHPDDRAWATAFCSQATSENRNHSFEYRMIAADGRSVWLRDIASVVVEEGKAKKLRGIIIDITERKQAEEERQAHLWFLESMDQVNQAIQGTHDLEQMLRDVLDVVLAIFTCDRAWLLYPCDPAAVTWYVPMERTQPEYPGAFAAGITVPMEGEMATVLDIMRNASGPVKFGPGGMYPLPTATAQQHAIQSVLAMTITPKVDQPYLFGVHQCSHPRLWVPQEERLFQEIGRRLADALETLLTYRRLQESEERYREIFANTTDVITVAEVMADQRFKLLDINPSLEKMLGLNRNQVVGGFLEDFSQFHASARMMLTEHRRCLEQKAPVEVEKDWPTPTGSWHIHFTLHPIRNAADQIYRIVGVGRNLTAQRRAEERLRLFLDHVTDAFFLHDAAGIVLDVNQRACEMLGYTRQELMGMSPHFFDPNLTPQAVADLNRRLTAGETIITESQHRRKDGSLYPIEIRIRPVWEGGQQFNVSLVQDITERKQAQEALTLFRTLLDHTNDSIEIVDPETGRYLDVNAQGCLAHGYTRAEFLTLSLPDIDPHLGAIPWSEIHTRMQQTNLRVFESQHRRKDGTLFPVEVMANYITLDRDYLVGIVRDITARKQADAALKESEERYRILYEDNPTMYFTVDAAGTVLSVNRFGAEHLGYTVAELAGRSVLQVSHVEDRTAAQGLVGQCIEQPGKLFQWILRKVRKDGSILWVEETSRAIQNGSGALVVLIVCEDITERKRAEHALIESHNLLHAVVEGTADIIFAKDRQGHYLMMNSAGARALGRTVADILGKDDREIFPLEAARSIMERDRRVMALGEAQTFEEVENSPIGTRTYLTTKGVYRDIYGTVNGIVGITRDITALKHLEEQFRQAQKMEAVGRLAGGVAHDFNNLLTVINGYSQLIFKRLPPDDPNRKRLGEIQKAGERAANLTRQLLAFSRKQMLQPQVVNLNTLLTELLKLLRRLIGEDIELALTPAGDLGWTQIDPGQFEQAIINLAVNARDAMPQGGQLSITTYNSTIEADYAARYPEVQAGLYVAVTMRDTGVGMTETTKLRIFEPFFTTKDIGKGTGLGLAMVYGFVKQSGGHIEVVSDIGHGTTFKLYLPRTEKTGIPVHVVYELHELPQGTETILLVEDEDAVRDLVRQVLQSGGYTVLEASNGPKGVDQARQYPGPIHLLITDLVMPQMSGRQLAEQLTTMQPGIQILFMSGYTAEEMTRYQVHEANIAFLQKPFDPLSLAQKVRSLLDGQGRRDSETVR